MLDLLITAVEQNSLASTPHTNQFAVHGKTRSNALADKGVEEGKVRSCDHHIILAKPDICLFWQGVSNFSAVAIFTIY